MVNRMRYFTIAVVLALAAVVVLAHPTRAQSSSCQVTTSPYQVLANSDVNYQFDFTNNDPSSHIDWITITTPTSSFDIVSVSASGWNSYIDSTGAEFNQGDLAPGGNLTLNVEIGTGPFESGEMDWGIYAYDGSDSNGPGNSVCQNNTPTQMTDNTPYISNINVSDVTQSSVNIAWTTSLPATSQVDYGLSDTYGSFTSPNTRLITSHSEAVSGLTPNTGYHYQIVSTTPSGGEETSPDNTFVTAEKQVSQELQNSSGSNPKGLSEPLGVTITKPSDNIPPVLTFTNLPSSRVFKSAPTLTGQASDKVALQLIEYSTDGGQNWLPVDSAPGLNTSQTTFSFTPVNLPDGTYGVMARAVNDGGYTTTTPSLTIVLDRLPPLSGGDILSLGPQVLEPGTRGVINSMAGVDQKLTLSAVGGPTSISLTASSIGSSSDQQVFSLTQSPDTLLWSGIVSLSTPGQYNIVANAVDGAGIKTSGVVSTMNIVSDPHTFDKATNKPLPTKVTLYYLDTDSHSWVVWDGSGYSETNPQSTDSHGNYKLFVPPGTYYLKVAAQGYQILDSKIFKTSQSEPLTTSLGLSRLHKISLGVAHLSFPSLSAQTVSLSSTSAFRLSGGLVKLIGQALPDFTLVGTNGTTLSAADLLGRPTLLTLGTTWSPVMDEQLNALSRLQPSQAFNIEPVAMQQSASQVQAYMSIAGLSLNWLVDPDSSLSVSYGSPDLPTQLFVDRGGVVRQVVYGVLSVAQIENRLAGLQ
jgi:peroxiredoxin